MRITASGSGPGGATFQKIQMSAGAPSPCRGFPTNKHSRRRLQDANLSSRKPSKLPANDGSTSASEGWTMRYLAPSFHVMRISPTGAMPNRLAQGDFSKNSGILPDARRTRDVCDPRREQSGLSGSSRSAVSPLECGDRHLLFGSASEFGNDAHERDSGG